MCLVVLWRSSASFGFCACLWSPSLLDVPLSSICFTVSVYCSARRVCVAALFCNVGLHDSVPRLPWCVMAIWESLAVLCWCLLLSTGIVPQSKLGLYFTHGATSFMRGCRPVRVPVGAWASPRRGLYHACGACPPPLAKGCLAGILFSVICSFRRDCAREARLIVVFVFVFCALAFRFR